MTTNSHLPRIINSFYANGDTLIKRIIIEDENIERQVNIMITDSISTEIRHTLETLMSLKLQRYFAKKFAFHTNKTNQCLRTLVLLKQSRVSITKIFKENIDTLIFNYAFVRYVCQRLDTISSSLEEVAASAVEHVFDTDDSDDDDDTDDSDDTDIPDIPDVQNVPDVPDVPEIVELAELIIATDLGIDLDATLDPRVNEYLEEYFENLEPMPKRNKGVSPNPTISLYKMDEEVDIIN